MISKATCMFVAIFPFTSGYCLTIVTDGNSDYSIVIPDDSIPAEKTAAEEFAQHIEKMSGAKLPIVSESRFSCSNGIFLGNTRQLEKLGIHPDWEQLGKEGYLLRVADGNLIIAGGRPRGTLYGVYWVLEKHLGCRWFAPDTTVIPERATVSLPELNFVGRPEFEFREPLMFIGWGKYRSRWWHENFSQEYVARTRNSTYVLNRINIGTESDRIGPRYGGTFKIPYFGHNLTHLVRFDKYGDTNPEYYALQKDGRRQSRDEVHVDLCLTNPEVARAAARTMLEWMRANPDADMFFVGQSDSSHHYCQCDKCVALKNKYPGRRSGPTLEFVNAIARLVEKEFPDKLIGTYAYLPTYQAPANLTAHRNVVIWFCPCTRCFCHALHEGPLNKGIHRYVDELETWKRIASKVYVYDYRLGSSACLPGVSPPFDLLKLPETFRAYHRMGVEGVYVDGLAEIQIGYGFLRYWLMTQLFNDLDFDFDRGLGEFLDASYGAAAGDIREFIDMACDPASYAPATAKWVSYVTRDPANYAPAIAKRAAIWYAQGSAKWNELRNDCLVNYRHLSAEAIEAGYEIFERARKAVAADAKALEHVQSARMPVQYAMLEYLPAEDARLKKEAVSYVSLARKLQLRSVGDLLLEEYRQKIGKKLGMRTADWPPATLPPDE